MFSVQSYEFQFPSLSHAAPILAMKKDLGALKLVPYIHLLDCLHKKYFLSWQILPSAPAWSPATPSRAAQSSGLHSALMHTVTQCTAGKERAASLAYALQWIMSCNRDPQLAAVPLWDWAMAFLLNAAAPFYSEGAGEGPIDAVGCWALSVFPTVWVAFPEPAARQKGVYACCPVRLMWLNSRNWLLYNPKPSSLHLKWSPSLFRDFSSRASSHLKLPCSQIPYLCLTLGGRKKPQHTWEPSPEHTQKKSVSSWMGKAFPTYFPLYGFTWEPRIGLTHCWHSTRGLPQHEK